MALHRAQLALFDTGRQHDAETPTARQRRLNRARQTNYRRRRQFAPPLYDAPSWTRPVIGRPVVSVLVSEFATSSTSAEGRI